jgi:hypothetical protein
VVNDTSELSKFVATNPALDIGANASAEEVEESMEDTASKAIDIVVSFNLKQAFYDKPMFKLRVQSRFPDFILFCAAAFNLAPHALTASSNLYDREKELTQLHSILQEAP